MYDILEGAIKKATKSFGKLKPKANADDKLSRATEDLIEKRSKIKREMRINYSVELTELNKIIKRSI